MNNTKVINNSIISLFAQIIPIGIAIIFIPIAIHLLGNQIFGLYTLLVTIIVLFNYLNFGIAPATTKELSKYLARENHEKVFSIILNSFVIMFSLGVLFGLFFLFAHDEIAKFMIKEKSIQNLASQVLYTFTYLSPLIIIVIFLRSLLEAKQNFLTTSLNRAFLNSMIFILPTVTYFDNIGLTDIFKLLVVIYLFSVFVLSYIAYKEYLSYLKTKKFNLRESKELLNIGIWMMISSLAGIGLYYTDRFIIGATISAIAVAYYATAYDIITRLNIISGSITSALFPAFAYWYEIGNKEAIQKSIILSVKIILFLVSFVGLTIIIYSQEILSTWINEDFAEKSYKILQILTVGVLFNTLSVVPFRVLSAIGFQKKVAMVYIIETPLTVFFVYFLIKIFGILGAAIGYNIRAFFEMVVLFYLLLLKNIDLAININFLQVIKIAFLYLGIYSAGFLIFFYQNYKSCFAFLLIFIFLIAQLFIFTKNEKKEIFQFINKIGIKWKK